MAIDTSGKWWVGSEAADIADYLKAYQAVRLTSFSIRPKAAATSHWVAWKNWPKQRLNWVMNPDPEH